MYDSIYYENTLSPNDAWDTVKACFFFIPVKYFEKKNPEKEFNMADHNFNTNETVATVIAL